MTESYSKHPEIVALLRLLNSQRRLLSDAGANESLITALSGLMLHIQRLHPVDAAAIAEGRHGRERKASPWQDWLSTVRDFPLEEVDRVLSDENTARAVLEAIAVGRFKVPKGSLRSLGNIQQLREKLQSMARNERAHVTIAKVAKDSAD